MAENNTKECKRQRKIPPAQDWGLTNKENPVCARFCFLIDPPTPFGVGGLNSIALASVPYRHVSICS